MTQESQDGTHPLVAAVVRSLYDRFVETKVPETLFYYGDPQFTVIDTTTLASAIGRHGMRLDGRSLSLAQIALAYRNYTLDWITEKHPSGAITRQYCRGKNTAGNVLAVKKAMRQASNEFYFAEEEIEMVTNAIIFTSPRREDSYENHVRPLLGVGCHDILRTVALAEMNVCGAEPQRFLKGAVRLFADIHIDVMMELREKKDVKDVEKPMQDLYRARLCSHLGNQVHFVEQRRDALSRETQGLHPDVQHRIRSILYKYGETIDLLSSAMIKFQKMDIVLLMRQLLPSAFPESEAA